MGEHGARRRWAGFSPRTWRIWWRSRGLWCASAAACAPACTPTSLDTVDLGDHPEPADLPIDEAFFHCEIQPRVLTSQRCAGGAPTDGGGCHLARSALRLIEVPVTPACRAGVLLGAAPPESQVNFARIAASIGLDAASSPLYRRPLGLDSHPRAIFTADAPEAALLESWLDRGDAP